MEIAKVVTITIIFFFGGGVYPYIHVLPGRFLFQLMNLNLVCKETGRFSISPPQAKNYDNKIIF